MKVFPQRSPQRCCLPRRRPLSRKPAARARSRSGSLPLTGNTAWAGKTNRIAAAIAAEEVNAEDLAGATRSNSCSATASASRARRTIRRSA